MRIASVGQVEVGNIMELGNTDDLLWANVAKKNKWIEPEESQSPDS